MRREIVASYSVVIVREGGRSSIPEASVIESISRGVLDVPPSRGMTTIVRRGSRTSIPRDDLALVLMDVFKIDQVTAPPAHQKFRAAGADRVVAAAAGGRFAVVIFFRQ